MGHQVLFFHLLPPSVMYLWSRAQLLELLARFQARPERCRVLLDVGAQC